MSEQSSALARVLLAPNPGPMTLDGTNSYLVSEPGASSVVVVDPGPDDPRHLQALAAAGPVDLILVTHRHHDHTAGSAELARLTGAPVRGLDPAFCIGADPITDGEVINAAGVHIRVVATPGHTADSVCFVLAQDGASGAILTGDTILGRGTTVIAAPDGSLADYLNSLMTLRGMGPLTVLPAHGEPLLDLEAICDGYLAHRHRRLDEVRAALRNLGPDASAAAVTDVVYSDIDPAVRFAAEQSVEAQLAYLSATDRAGG
ncbi:MBL fold metallo-hydrolase [Mycetocola miduiensis]|uniref:Glyoxylase, beta-lactamase superfamily II n=1 Tax=Mycetocola miduiensis TaxID=995034 RepID=A0A1I5AZ09_9MICO|nr:MBL fold metallo-hydrolase [Mycetocola miduiensis]SFN67449.1 Glyoxylase, beta-lactamase superfamily II [Mycetocola miduiensis]